MKAIRKISVLAAVCLILTSCTSDPDTGITLADPVEVKYDTAVAARMDLARRYQYEAYVKAEIEKVSFDNMSGILDEIFVSLGDQVSKGDPLAALDVSDLEEQIAMAADELEYKSRKLDYELGQKQYDIELARIELDALISSGADGSEIALAELSVEKLVVEKEYIRKNGELEIEMAKNRLEKLRQSLEGTVISAPCDGEVVYIAPLSKGDRVAAHNPVVFVANKSNIYVSFEGTETISDKARTTALINGIEYEVQKQKYDQQEYLSLILSGIRPPTIFKFVQTPSEDVQAGDFAALMVYDSEKQDVLAVPTNAIFYNAGEYYVYRIEDGQKVYTGVKCGIRTDSFTEITDGLQEGDVVFVKQ
ncbi:MAG: biotin/lipoyl-binding protein [Clostridiales bacterium]|nr:biotin/lipoyl-binding protein [Clostridiales bacterium]